MNEEDNLYNIILQLIEEFEEEYGPSIIEFSTICPFSARKDYNYTFEKALNDKFSDKLVKSGKDARSTNGNRFWLCLSTYRGMGNDIERHINIHRRNFDTLVIEEGGRDMPHICENPYRLNIRGNSNNSI